MSLFSHYFQHKSTWEDRNVPLARTIGMFYNDHRLVGVIPEVSMRKIILVLLLLAVAGVMRFAKLGTWSFDHDELFTILETNILFGLAEVPETHLQDGTVRPEDSQLTRLPKMLPLAYATHRLGYYLFGENEFGSRVMPAVFGILGIGAVFLLGWSIFGCSGTMVLTLLMMFWPAHVFNSQQNRFNSETFFFEILVFLLAAHTVRQRSVLSGFLLGLAAGGMILCHTLTGLIWGIVLAGILAAWITERRPLPLGVGAVLIGFSLLFAGFAVFYIVPLASGWNDFVAWGYSPPHAVMATINMLGFPVALFAALGGLLALTKFRSPDNAFWATVALGCGVCVLILPNLIALNPMYLFLFVFPFLVLAARFTDHVFRRLREPGTAGNVALAVAWIGLVCCSNLPSLASYYLDGSRCNHREAFEYVREHWRENDRLTGYTMGSAKWYIPECNSRIPLKMSGAVEQLEELTESDDRRLWIVVHSYRGGLDPELRRWLGKHCSYELRVGKKRFDYDEYTVEVFLCEPHEETGPPS